MIVISSCLWFEVCGSLGGITCVIIVFNHKLPKIRGLCFTFQNLRQAYLAKASLNKTTTNFKLQTINCFWCLTFISATLLPLNEIYTGNIPVISNPT